MNGRVGSWTAVSTAAAIILIGGIVGSAGVQPAAGAKPAASLVLVDGGTARSVIVADGALSASEQGAVEELQKHIEEMSGAKLPVVTPDKAAAGQTRIIIGNKTAARLCPDVKLDGLGLEGFVVKTSPGRLVIAGGEKRGTLYGVYTLLESLGVRWWSPQETFVPRSKTVTVPATDLRQTPPLEYRDLLYGEIWSEAGRLWCARNKVNAAGGDKASEKYGGSYFVAGEHAHNTIDLVEDSVGKGKLKPEMWALVTGRDGAAKRTQTEICMTNPEVIAASIRSLVKLYKAHPETNYLIVAHEDNNDYCRCDQCAAVAKEEGDPSGLNLQFINTLAAALEKEVPGARIRTDAYLWTRKVPKTLRPRDNVMISFAPIEADFAHPLAAASNEENRLISDDIKAWNRVTKNIFIWNYVGNRVHYLMPNPDFDAMVPDVQFFVANGAIGIREQGTHAGVATEFAALRMWVLGKVLWDPKADGNALMSEFLTGYYGLAAGAIRKYIDIMHDYGRKNDYHLGRFMRMNAPFLQPAILADAEAALREADKAAAGDPALEKRVRHAHMPLWYMLAKRGPDSPTWKAVEAKVGKLDFTEIAARSNQTAKKWGIYAVADPEESAPWFAWLTDYAALLKKGGPVLPPELKAEDLKTGRLVQARQIDGCYLNRTGQWLKMDGASDGWVLKIVEPGWMVQHTFSPYDEYTIGKTYTLSVRVKGAEKKKDGVAVRFGLEGDAGDRLPSKDVPAAQLADGQFHVYDLGPFKAGKKVMLWLAASRDGSMTETYLDCLWLKEVVAK